MDDMYAVSGETLTGIANAIRSKTGSDEQMPVAAMASSIEGISPLPSFITKLDGGSFTLDHMDRVELITGTRKLRLHHNFGVVPKMVAMWDNIFKDDENIGVITFGLPDAFIRLMMYCTVPNPPWQTAYYSCVYTYSSTTNNITNANMYDIQFDIRSNYIDFTIGDKIKPGRTYEWIAFY